MQETPLTTGLVGRYLFDAPALSTQVKNGSVNLFHFPAGPWLSHLRDFGEHRDLVQLFRID
jgi:hypothetical protein